MQGLKKGDITEVIHLSCSYPRPTFHEILVHNDINPFQVAPRLMSYSTLRLWQLSRCELKSRIFSTTAIP